MFQCTDSRGIDRDAGMSAVSNWAIASTYAARDNTKTTACCAEKQARSASCDTVIAFYLETVRDVGVEIGRLLPQNAHGAIAAGDDGRRKGNRVG